MRISTGPLSFPIAIDREAIHRSLYDALREAMLGGRLGPGARLPSSRDLAEQLEVARGTVVAVYEQLRSEGYLTSTRGSGTVVASELPDRWFDAAPRARPTTPKRIAPPLARRAIASPFNLAPRGNPRPLRPHLPAVDMFPIESFSSLVARRARRDESLFLGDTDVRGHAPLREALAEHLRVARGVVCRTDQIVVVPSAQQGFDLVGRLVLNAGDEVWMEDPGYVGARAVLSSLGAKLVPVPVDAQGIDVAVGIARAPNARLAYVTPGHQAPLGITMTLERRLRLLDWAINAEALVIEDDYDSDYRYEGRPVPALQGLDRAGAVVHIGTFSKTLLPSLRLAYVVVPDALLDRFLALRSIVDRFTPPLLQAALADFMTSGQFGRHLRRMREIYAERRDALLVAATRELADHVELVGASAGLDFTVRLRNPRDDVALARALEAERVEALPLSPHGHVPSRHRGLVLGFAPFSPTRIRKSVEAIRRALRNP